MPMRVDVLAIAVSPLLLTLLGPQISRHQLHGRFPSISWWPSGPGLNAYCKMGVAERPDFYKNLCVFVGPKERLFLY